MEEAYDDNKIGNKIYCRKCMRFLPENNFYDSVDNGFIDSNGKLSVCKDCIQKLYNELYEKESSIEKAIHKLCMALNIRYSNEAVEAVEAQIDTLAESKKSVKNVFGIYKSKLIATQKTMDKSIKEDMSYTDISTVYVDKKRELNKIPLPKEVIEFWGENNSIEDIEFLEREFANFKKTHKADTYAEIVLLKRVCYTELDIEKARLAGESTEKLVKELQGLMKDLAISPNVAQANTNQSKGAESYGLWIADIENNTPAQLLATDPRFNWLRDVTDVDGYFKKYFVRPQKNFITGSRDFDISSGYDDNFDFEDSFKESGSNLMDLGEEAKE